MRDLFHLFFPKASERRVLLIVGVCQRFSMRPTLKKYFGVGPGSEIIYSKIISIFYIIFMLTSANKNHSKIIYAPVTR